MVDINRDANGRGIYLARCSPTLRGIVVLVFTKSVGKKCHLVGTLFTIYKHFRDFVKCIFTILLQI